jgi:hypothetical protein
MDCFNRMDTPDYGYRKGNGREAILPPPTPYLRRIHNGAASELPLVRVRLCVNTVTDVCEILHGRACMAINYRANLIALAVRCHLLRLMNTVQGLP